jgi:hypothetical protein
LTGVVGEAYGIAANCLKQTGRLPADVDIHQPLFDWIAEACRVASEVSWCSLIALYRAF